MDSLYTRCPSCGIIAPAGSLSVALTDDGTFDPDQAMCPHCHRHQPGPFLDLDPERRAYVHQVHTDYRRNILHELRLFHDDGPAG
jgi:hypothetical protein